MEKEYIKSPLNYTGNKYRILDQIECHFPTNMESMLDLFCGGATVGINSSCKRVFFVDNNERVINLLQYLANTRYETLQANLEKLIAKYNLSYSAKDGYSYYSKKIKGGNPNNGLKCYNERSFYKLREDYNKLKQKNTRKANLMLYALLVYGFNNDLRFSSNGEYNLPCGKTDLNKSNLSKVKAFTENNQNMQCQYICANFYDESVKKIVKAVDFVYMDPPYLITDAVYNENNGWNEQLEYKLLDFLDYLISINKPFILSNVLRKKGRTNEPLCYWIRQNQEVVKVKNINYHYRGASYNKKDRNANEQEAIIIFEGEK